MATIYDLLWGSTNRFALFAPSHLAALWLFTACAVLMFVFGRSAAPAGAKRALRIGLGLCIFAFETLYVLYPLPLGSFDVRYSLPLQICDITAYATALALVSGWAPAREVSCFMGLTTTLLACLTPDMTYDFPHVEFICFFATHALVVAAVLYQVVGLGHWPQPGAARRVFLLINGYGAAMVGVNLALDANYVYICAKPQLGSPMDWLGPWPVYIVVMDVLFVGALALVAAALRGLERRAAALQQAA